MEEEIGKEVGQRGKKEKIRKMKNETVKGKYKSGKRGRGGNLMEMRREKERRNVKAKEGKNI